jgi:hypothetical protein
MLLSISFLEISLRYKEIFLLSLHIQLAILTPFVLSSGILILARTLTFHV